MLHVGRPQWRLFCLVWGCALTATQAMVQSSVLTTVSDTVSRADGSPASGILLISWPAFTTADRHTMAARNKSVSCDDLYGDHSLYQIVLAAAVTEKFAFEFDSAVLTNFLTAAALSGGHADHQRSGWNHRPAGPDRGCRCAGEFHDRQPGCRCRAAAWWRPIVIEDCDVSREPMYCRKVKLRYRHGCEKIEVIQAKKCNIGSPGDLYSTRSADGQISR